MLPPTRALLLSLNVTMVFQDNVYYTNFYTVGADSKNSRLRPFLIKSIRRNYGLYIRNVRGNPPAFLLFVSLFRAAVLSILARKLTCQVNSASLGKSE